MPRRASSTSSTSSRSSRNLRRSREPGIRLERGRAPGAKQAARCSGTDRGHGRVVLGRMVRLGPHAADSLCARVGLDPNCPHTCLAPLKPSYVDFILHWVEGGAERPRSAARLRGRDPAPHPKRTENWDDIDLARYANLALFPRERGFPRLRTRSGTTSTRSTMARRSPALGRRVGRGEAWRTWPLGPAR
jgi:hypothetical protein